MTSISQPPPYNPQPSTTIAITPLGETPMTKTKNARQYVLLPIRGLHAEGRTSNDKVRQFLAEAHHQFQAAGATAAMVRPPSTPDVQIRVLDTIAEDGAKLV